MTTTLPAPAGAATTPTASGPAAAPSTAVPDRAPLLPHFTSGPAWRHPDVPVLVRGQGPWVWDERGTRYLDGLSGLFSVNLGHGRRDLADAAAQQLQTLAFASTWGYAHPSALAAAELVTSLAPGDLDRVFFVSSGSEAVESAVKLARSYHLARGQGQRVHVIAREWAYHGTTLGALSLTGIPKVRAPYLPLLSDTVRHVRNTRGDTVAPGGGPGSLAGVEAIEQQILELGPDTVSMVIAEPVQNGGGALVPPDGYWPALRAVCDRYGVLLCADEVINAFGRVGHWFASERFGVVPDLLTFAKGITSSYVPCGGVLARTHVADTVYDTGAFVHGATFGSHPVATAVAVANLTAMRDEGVLEHVRASAPGLLARLQALDSPVVKEVRGTGFFHAVELMADRDTGAELTEAQRAELLGGVLATLVREAGLLIRPDDRGATMLVLAPPLICDDEVLDELVTRLARVLAGTADHLARTG